MLKVISFSKSRLINNFSSLKTLNCVKKSQNLNYLTKSKFNFSEKIRNEEILVYVMNDKYSVKPDKEFRINHSTLEKIDDITKSIESKKVVTYGKFF